MEERTISSEERKAIFEPIKRKSDRFISVALFCYFSFGIFLSFFYDTYLVAVGIGSLCLVAYFACKLLLPGQPLYQYILSSILAIFTAQFIYQMHGLFEMHFFVFVGSALLITYQNWRLQIPLIVLVVIHHATFAYLQYRGNDEIFFTQLAYLDMQSFLFHAALAAVIVAICGYWAYGLEGRSISEAIVKTALEGQLKNVKANIAFAAQISAGNLDTQYETATGQDELGTALIAMRDNLVQANLKEKHEKYITNGLALVDEMIRKNTGSLKDLANDLIRTIVKYMGVNQAGLFLVEGEGDMEYLSLTACYAFDRKKYTAKRFRFGEGLVGQCFLERSTMYMTEVPEGYVTITSGLGESSPKCIIIVPIMTNDDIVGVLELASFDEMKPYQLEFLKKISETIASSIISSQTNERIKGLLEASQQQTEELRAQEEEMRQSMEELQATQEEMRRHELHVNAMENPR